MSRLSNDNTTVSSSFLLQNIKKIKRAITGLLTIVLIGQLLQNSKVCREKNSGRLSTTRADSLAYVRELSVLLGYDEKSTLPLCAQSDEIDRKHASGFFQGIQTILDYDFLDTHQGQNAQGEVGYTLQLPSSWRSVFGKHQVHYYCDIQQSHIVRLSEEFHRDYCYTELVWASLMNLALNEYIEDCG